MEKLSIESFVHPFPTSDVEFNTQGIFKKLTQLNTQLIARYQEMIDSEKVDELQNSVDNWVETEAFIIFIKQVTTDCRSMEELIILILETPIFSTIANPIFAKDELSFTFLVKSIFCYSVELNFYKGILQRTSYSTVYHLQFIVEIINFWIDSNYQRFPSFKWLAENTAELFETQTEYETLINKFKNQSVYILMLTADYVFSANLLVRKIQTQNLAMEIGISLKKQGTTVDLAKLCSASVGEGIGEYLALYKNESSGQQHISLYTASWFDDGNMQYSGHIATRQNPSNFTIEQLSIEALILIYAKLNIDKDGHHAAQEIEDFEAYMISMGVELDSVVMPLNGVKPLEIVERPMYSLVHGEDVTRHFRLLGVQHSIDMMNLFCTESSMNTILERARSEESSHHFRGYISVFETYFTFLTFKQKQNLLVFLFEALTNPEEDIRETCATLMGIIIATIDLNSDDCSQSQQLFSYYFEKFVEADVATTPRHRSWIGHSLGSFVRAIFSSIDYRIVPHMGEVLLQYIEYYKDQLSVRLYLLKVMRFLPIERLSNDHQAEALNLIYQIAVMTSGKLRLECLEALYVLLPKVQIDIANAFRCDELFQVASDDHSPALGAMARQLNVYIKIINVDIPYQEIDEPSLLYLSNLKTATPAVVKRIQIDMLIELIWKQKVDAFYVAMHLSNLLKVSAYQDVREKAGLALLEIFPLIANEQRNDIVIELLRALEIEGYQFTKYIPPYLGKLINTLQEQEHEEILSDLIYKVKSANAQISILVLSTAATCIEDSFETIGFKRESINKMLSILLNGLVHFDNQISCEAFFQIGVKVLGNSKISLQGRERLYKMISKKVLSLVTNIDGQNTLGFLNSATSFNYIYGFLREASRQGLELEVTHPKKIAFFPGAYDPFSLAHKASACAIRDLGYEVYLAVDEFSWSKRTQPNIIRRDIVNMSIADELDIYLFPRRRIVNIANSRDIQELKNLFAPKPVYLVVGSDVLTHASAYRNEPARSELLNTNHIVFERAQGLGNVRDDELLESVISDFASEVVRLTLSSDIETISSTQIRTFVDENRDISELTETLVQKYIYEKNLYRREPQFKDTMTVQSMSVEIYDELSESLIHLMEPFLSINQSELQELLSKKRYMHATRLLVIKNLQENSRIEGIAFFHWLRSGDIYTEFNSQYLTDFIRDNASGRILVIDSIVASPLCPLKNFEQNLLTETLCFSLGKDYSYVVYRNTFNLDDQNVTPILEQNGFQLVKDQTGETIYVVNMLSPITLNLDIKSMIKAPYRNDPKMECAIDKSRMQLTKALCGFYPGHLVLSFDRTMIYEHLIKIICEENCVSTIPSVPRKLGESMLVPYGEIFKRWIVPNTVTKALHTERYFNRKGDGYKVKAFPNYLDLEIQTRTIKSYNRPVILIDDLFDKGNRFKAIQHYFEKFQIPIKTLAIAILSGRGKAWLEMEGIPVKAAYFIPRIRTWFNESDLYPILGGDSVDSEEWSGQSNPSDGLNRSSIPSLNLLLPYTFPKHIKGVTNETVAAFSKICLENSYELLKVLEETYLATHGRNLTMATISDVLVSPRHPEKGSKMYYEPHVKPTEIIAGDLALLHRINPFFQGDTK